MNIYPRLEARVSVIERRQTFLEGHVEEALEDMTISIKHLSDDMTGSFKALTDYHIRTEHQIDTRFNLVDSRLYKIETRLDKLETRFDHVETRLDKLETRFDHVETLLTQILARLPKQEP